VTLVVQGDAKQGEPYLKKAVELSPSRESTLMVLASFTTKPVTSARLARF